MSSTLKAKRERKLNERFGRKIDGMALPRELTRVYGALLRHSAVTLPLKLTRALTRDSKLDGVWTAERLGDVVGDVLLSLFDSLGPIYGKAGQVVLSRMSPRAKRLAEAVRLTRLYGDWPAMPFAEVSKILDEEIPSWHEKLKVMAYPVGVASMAQVHAAVDTEGKSWVIKVIKPHARERLLETLGAIEQLLFLARPLTVTASGRRLVKEVEELVAALRREVDLDVEKRTIDRVRENIAKRRQPVLRIPETSAEFSTARVLTMERFVGVSLSDLVAHPEQVPQNARKKLARQVLAELLVQIFEDGLFHADPHAGNLILIEDGTIGLFDWGLAGELLDSDRRHIAQLLRAVMAMDLERLIDALCDLGAEAGQTVDRVEVKSELGQVARLIKRRTDAGKKPSLHELMEASLTAAEKLDIPIPEGLLMMAKSLLTVEGLARGIDPDVSLGRVATPVLFRAARPGLKDIWAMSLSMPKLARKLFF